MNFQDFDQFVLKTYNRNPVYFEKAKGPYLFDRDGNRWLDFISGIGVTNLGHSHPALNKALKKQLKKIWHSSNLFYIEPQGQVAKKISALSFPGKTFFCNSGAEANESAIKLCRKWGNQLDKSKQLILSLKQSFHGRTLASLTLTGQAVYQQGFAPLPGGFDYIEANNLAELTQKIGHQLAGLFIEVVQGEGGVYPLSREFLETARELTHKHQALLIIDEVQTGIMRTGKYFAYQHFNITPDAITMAKALGNGIPIGALHVESKYADLLQPGDHASTFGGNFLATAVANKVLELIQEPKFRQQILLLSDYLEDQLNKVQQTYPQLIHEVRGLGFMWGLVSDKAQQIAQGLFAKRVLSTNIKGKVVRILPPLISTKKEIDLFVTALHEVMRELS